jgi:hypothetical protein
VLQGLAVGLTQWGNARKTSGNDASFLEAEIAISIWCRGANDDVIDQLELQDSAGFKNSPRGNRREKRG